MYKTNKESLKAKSYKEISNLSEKKVLLRTCLNVTTDKDWNMVDATRYQESLPLIKELAKQSKALLITAHLGRPKNNESEFSLAKIAKKLESDLWTKVNFITKLEDIKNIEKWIFMLENVRFFDWEESTVDDLVSDFINVLTKNFDVFINDAFADYRKSASTYHVAKKLPSYIWPVFMEEVLSLTKLSNCKKPFVAILWWAKLSEKLDVILSLLEKADKVLIWWAMAYTILKVKWVLTWRSLVEDDKLEIAKEILNKYQNKIVLPIDHAVIDVFKDPWDEIFMTVVQDIPREKIWVDIWPKTIKLFKKVIKEAKTIIRNGPMWVYEREGTAKWTFAIGSEIEKNKEAYKVAWWWDVISAINKLKIWWFDHVSTWWWAMLSLLANKEFHTLDVILNNK